MKHHWLYCASTPSGIVKVGRTSNLKKRQYQLQSQQPGMRIRRTWDLGECHSRCAWTYERNACDKLRGAVVPFRGREWFRMPVDDAIALVGKAFHWVRCMESRKSPSKAPKARVAA
jgi:hypothetical protein